jgi:histidinol-phosphate aminotransferase
MSRFFSKSLESLAPYTPGEQPKEAGLIKLNTNENPYGPGPKVVEVLRELSAETLRLYPDPECRELVSAIEAYYGLSAGQVMVGNGSDELLGFAFMAYGDETGEIVFPETSYGFYPVFGKVFKAAFKTVPLKGDLTIDPVDYYNAKGTVVLANPNAPTGMGLRRGQIRDILDNNQDNLVIIDEAYVDFGGESCVQLIPEYDNLLVIQTFSKSRSLAGARVGFALGNRELIADLNRIKYSFNPYNLDRLAIRIATAAINDKEYFEATRREIIATREWFAAELERRGFVCLPSQANFIFARPTNPMGGKLYFEALRRQSILVRHFDKAGIEDYVRITIGTREEMERLLSATDTILQGKFAE